MLICYFSHKQKRRKKEKKKRNRRIEEPTLFLNILNVSILLQKIGQHVCKGSCTPQEREPWIITLSPKRSKHLAQTKILWFGTKGDGGRAEESRGEGGNILNLVHLDHLPFSSALNPSPSIHRVRWSMSKAHERLREI